MDIHHSEHTLCCFQLPFQAHRQDKGLLHQEEGPREGDKEEQGDHGGKAPQADGTVEQGIQMVCGMTGVCNVLLL